MYLIFTVLGYIGALMTAVYSFRIVFRVLGGEECEEARELRESGHVVHAEPENPATGEPEDTDVGFPGPEHHIAERRAADADRDGRAWRSWPCSPADPGAGGRRGDPQLPRADLRRLSPSSSIQPSTGASW